MKKISLKPCPMCGGDAMSEHRSPGGTMASGMEPDEQRVGCKSCGLWLVWESPQFEWGKQAKHDNALAQKQAMTWNKRITPPEGV